MTLLRRNKNGQEPSPGEVEVEVARKMGRPLVLSQPIIDEVAMVLRRGSYLETAAAWIGVTYRTLARWRQRGLKEIERVEHAVEVGLPEKECQVQESERIYVEFCHATERAIAESDVRDLTTIETAASNGLWAAAAWRLERRHAHQWGRPWRPEEDPEDGPDGDPVSQLVEEMRRDRANA